MKKLKVFIAFILSLCMVLGMNFGNSKPVIAHAAESHTCSDGGMTGVTVTVNVHGPTATECYHKEIYSRTFCQYPGCNKVVKSVLLDTDNPSHTPKLKFMYCNGTYLHFNRLCEDCGFLLGTSTTICHQHPGDHPLY